MVLQDDLCVIIIVSESTAHIVHTRESLRKGG